MTQQKNKSAKRDREVPDEAYDPVKETLELEERDHPPPRQPPSRLRQTQFLIDEYFPTFMSFAVGFEDLQPRAFALYLNRLMAHSGSPKDPLERMLLEQVALAHFCIVRLRSSVGGRSDKDVVEAYSSAATRLTAEFRRLIMTLQEYRERAGSTRKAVVPSASHATAKAASPAPPPSVPSPQTETSERSEGKTHDDTELGSNGKRRSAANSASQPKAGSSRPEKSCTAWPADSGGAETPARVRPPRSSLGKSNGAAESPRKGQGRQKRRQATKGSEVREGTAVGTD